jgi:hypothetical protein
VLSPTRLPSGRRSWLHAPEARLCLALLAGVSAGCLFLAPRPDVPPGAFRERTVILSIDGTPGLAFEGSYGTPAQSTSVRGTVPAQYSLKASVAVVGTFTKATAEGEMVIRVLVDDREVQRRSTTQPFGTIVISQRFSP